MSRFFTSFRRWFSIVLLAFVFFLVVRIARPGVWFAFFEFFLGISLAWWFVVMVFGMWVLYVWVVERRNGFR